MSDRSDRSDTHGPLAVMGRAFSLVEVLAAIAIISIVTFLAIPNLLQIKTDGERSLAISRAETLNLAMASYIQVTGQAAATNNWSTAGDTDGRYTLIAPYAAFAPTNIDSYFPSGYSAALPSTISPLTKATLTGPSGTVSY